MSGRDESRFGTIKSRSTKTCEAKTCKGGSCKNKVAPGSSKFCKLHHKLGSDFKCKEKKKRKRAMGKKINGHYVAVKTAH